MQPDLLTKAILPLSLFLAMFAMGLALRPADVRTLFGQPMAMRIALAAQWLALPALALLLCHVMQLPPEIAVGTMIIALAPGGAHAGTFMRLWQGDSDLSTRLSGLISVATPLVLPLGTAWSVRYFIGDGTLFELPVLRAIVQLLILTMIPTALGMFVSTLWPGLASPLQRALRWLSLAILLVVASLIVLDDAGHMPHFYARAGLAALTLNLLMLLGTFAVARRYGMPRTQATTVALEASIQNGLLAMVVAGTLIGDPIMMIPAASYSLIMVISAGAFCWWLEHRGRRPAGTADA